MSPRFDPRARLDQFPILRVLRDRVLVFDGAMGTQIQSANLTLDDFRGKEGCNELLVETRPDVIGAIHEKYFAAGADVVETDSFGGQPYVLAEFDIGHRAFELNQMAAAVARKVADRFSTKERPRFVSGSMGPGTKLVTLGHISAHELFDAYKVYAKGLIAGGVDCLNIETCQDILQVKLAVATNRDRGVRDRATAFVDHATGERTRRLEPYEQRIPVGCEFDVLVDPQRIARVMHAHDRVGLARQSAGDEATLGVRLHLARLSAGESEPNVSALGR